MTDNVIIIPTRLEATRLPNKPLKKINNIEYLNSLKYTSECEQRNTSTMERDRLKPTYVLNKEDLIQSKNLDSRRYILHTVPLKCFLKFLIFILKIINKLLSE